MLCGKSLVDLNSWSDFQLDEFPEAQTVFAIADATELPTAASALHKLPEGMTCGIATGSTAEAVSWFLLKNYFRFVAPAEGARVDSSNDNHAHSDRTLTIAFTGKSVCATEWIDTAGSLIDGPASHIVVGPKTCTEEPFLLLSCLCELGYSAGNAVEIVNKVFRDELLSKDGPGLTLLGDPTPRLYPFIWQEVIADLIPNGPSRVVSFTNNGPPMRIYRFSTTEQIPLCTPGLVDKGIFCRVYRHDSEQHLFVFAKNVLPQTLLVPLHQAKDSD